MVCDEDWLSKRADVLFELCGGQEVARMLAQYHTQRMSYRRLSQLHALPEATVRTRMIRARMVLRRLGLMPSSWDASREHSSVLSMD